MAGLNVFNSRYIVYMHQKIVAFQGRWSVTPVVTYEVIITTCIRRYDCSRDEVVPYEVGNARVGKC